MAGTYGYQNLFNESITAVTATPNVALGTRRIEGGNEYVYVYNANTSTISVGYGCIASANSAYSVGLTSAVGDYPVGVCVNADIAQGYYGWVQTRGFAHVYSTNGAISQQSQIVIGAAGAFEAVVTALAGGTHAVCGYSVSTITSAGTGAAYLRI